MNTEEMLNKYKSAVDAALKEKMRSPEIAEKVVFDAMGYSVMLGGKRIRPVLIMEFCRVCGGDPDKAIPFAMAMEMIHTFSLIHDDLPCMDNDDMRRGKPSCHRAFGEDVALLAGDGLSLLAFSVAAETDLAADRVLKAMKCLADNAGVYGMVGGQICDLQLENKTDVTAEELNYMNSRKTGALIRASAEIGCILAGANAGQTAAAVKYADCIGIAFQVIDDVLDVVGDEKLLGKPIGSDAENGKPTWATLLGLDRARQYARELTEQAKTALGIFGDEADALAGLADKLANRSF